MKIIIGSGVNKIEIERYERGMQFWIDTDQPAPIQEIQDREYQTSGGQYAQVARWERITNTAEAERKRDRLTRGKNGAIIYCHCGDMAMDLGLCPFHHAKAFATIAGNKYITLKREKIHYVEEENTL